MNKLHFKLLTVVLIGLIFLCNTNEIAFSQSKASDGSVAAITNKSAALPLEKIKLPAGFSISVYAEVEGARSMVMLPATMTQQWGSLGTGSYYSCHPEAPRYCALTSRIGPKNDRERHDLGDP